MACLEMRKGSKWWYGRWTVRGQTIVKNLEITIEGRRPDSVNQESDRRFEQSRMRAQAKLEEQAKAATERHRASDLVNVYHRIQTGNDIHTLTLQELPEAWVGLSRKQPLSTSQEQRGRKIIERFLAFLHAHYPAVTELAGVSPEMAQAFMQAESDRNVAGRTYNRALTLMRGTFRHLRRQAGVVDNPFDDIVSRDEHTLHRKPFSQAELEALLAAAHADVFCRPLIITGACTALRLGDVCTLRWRDVDLRNRLIVVNTAKTGAKVQIPIFPPLVKELGRREQTGEFCFPEQARMYQANASGVTSRLGKFFAAAGFADEGAQRAVKLPPVDEIRRRWSEQFPGSVDRYSVKVRNLLPRVLELYLAGKVTREIMTELNLSKGGVSTYFNRIEKVLGFSILRTAREPIKVKDAALGKHEHGLRRVNQRGFHALRSTWVTLALSAGVPIELVRRVTGHAATEIVLSNYFQPGREQFRQALQQAMPKMLTAGGAPSRDDQMREILTKTSAKVWAEDSKKLLELLDQK